MTLPERLTLQNQYVMDQSGHQLPNPDTINNN